MLTLASAIAVIGLATGLIVAELGGASTNPATTSTKAGTSALQSGVAFFKGKTITLVSPDKPGGGFDQWARLIAPALGTYLHATVDVTNVPAGNTVAGQDAVAHAAPNGLTIGWLNAGPDIENTVLNLPALNFNPEREAYLGATAPGQTVILSLKSPSCSRYTSFSSFVSSSNASHPASEVLQTSGTGTFFMLMVDEAFGIGFHPLTGYASTSDQLAGFLRGDGCVTEVPASVADGLVTGGKARALAISVPFQRSATVAKDFKGVPTIAQEAAALHKTINSAARRNALAALTQVNNSTRVLFAPSATPASKVAALKAAFQWAMSNGSLRSSAIKQGNPVGWESGTTAKVQYQQFLAAAKRESSVLRQVIG